MVSVNAYGGIWHLMRIILNQSMAYGFHRGLWNSILIIIFPAQWLYGLLRALPGDEFLFVTVTSGLRFV
jgi:hypothetical protein